MAERKPPRMRAQTVEKRREIVRAATEVFGAKGFANGTLADIADVVGITHAGILHHFGSKDQLLLEVLTYRDMSDVEDLEPRHIPDGIDFFRHLVRTAIINAGRAGIVQTFVVLSGESVTENHPAREYFANRYATLRDEAAQALRKICEERGVADSVDIDRAAASVLAVMDGLQVQWLHDPAAVDLAVTTEFAIEAILAAVLTPSPSVLARENAESA